jgi:ligand-binding SRPBCC domain-containing protein
MIKLDFSETIKAPVERVFQYASDPDTAAEWQDGVIESRKNPGGETHQGTTMRSVRVLMGQRLESTAEVTEFVPNQKYAVRSTGGPVQFHMHQTFTPDGDTTRVNTHMEMEPGETMGVSDAVVARSLREQMENGARKLKDVLES